MTHPDRTEPSSTEGPKAQPERTMTILDVRARQAEQVDRHQRLVERLTYEVGKPRSLYITVAAVVGWIAYNGLGPTFGWRALDPAPFSGMELTISVLALLVTTMVLTTQNRQGRHAEQRAHLDLQVNLLAEQKVAKLIALVEELRRDMPSIHHRRDPTAEAMTRALDPVAIISALEEEEEILTQDQTQPAEEAPAARGSEEAPAPSGGDPRK